MNRRLPTITGSILQNGSYSILLLSGLLVLGAAGCASSRPSPLLVHYVARDRTEKLPDQEPRLKLVTYNIWGLPSWMTGAAAGRFPKIARELRRLDPDIILLQEVWTAKARGAAPQSGPWVMIRPASQHSFFQQSGLVTLSRFPIIGGEFYPFSRASFPDRFVNKGVLKVTVVLPDARVLNIWNTHLQDGGSAEVRRSQIRELAARVQAAEDGQVADLVGGDFNCIPDSDLFHELANALGPSVQQLGGSKPFVTWDGLSSKHGAGQTLDYVFVRTRASTPGFQARQQVAFTATSLRQRLSDHLGIEAELDLSPSPNLAGAGPEALSGSSFSDASFETETAGGN